MITNNFRCCYAGAPMIKVQLPGRSYPYVAVYTWSAVPAGVSTLIPDSYSKSIKFAGFEFWSQVIWKTGYIRMDGFLKIFHLIQISAIILNAIKLNPDTFPVDIIAHIKCFSVPSCSSNHISSTGTTNSIWINRGIGTWNILYTPVMREINGSPRRTSKSCFSASAYLQGENAMMNRIISKYAHCYWLLIHLFFQIFLSCQRGILNCTDYYWTMKPDI